MLGVPVHLAVDSVFDSIAEKFGKIVHASSRSVEDGDMSVNCIGLLVGEGKRIVELVDLKWEDKAFRVWVEEETADWVPDCLDDEESSEEGEPSVHACMGNNNFLEDEKLECEFFDDDGCQGNNKVINEVMDNMQASSDPKAGPNQEESFLSGHNDAGDVDKGISKNVFNF
ncbi:hypothetical protein Hanom_Chr07g00644331 [Helianthus anomalus]